jgi:hypothetical protein
MCESRLAPHLDAVGHGAGRLPTVNLPARSPFVNPDSAHRGRIVPMPRPLRPVTACEPAPPEPPATRPALVVGMPRSFSAAAMPRNDVTPLARRPVMSGAMSFAIRAFARGWSAWWCRMTQLGSLAFSESHIIVVWQSERTVKQTAPALLCKRMSTGGPSTPLLRCAAPRQADCHRIQQSKYKRPRHGLLCASRVSFVPHPTHANT